MKVLAGCSKVSYLSFRSTIRILFLFRARVNNNTIATRENLGEMHHLRCSNFTIVFIDCPLIKPTFEGVGVCLSVFASITFDMYPHSLHFHTSF